jgi:hypothetical protein
MTKQIFFISDFFSEQIIGGAELNDDVLIGKLSKRGYEIIKIGSNKITLEFLRENSSSFFIVSNFVGLELECRNFMSDNIEYMIYEHDHKFLDTRDPSVFCENDTTINEVVIPTDNVINSRFYAKAKSVVCLSNICKDVMERTLNIDNVFSIGTSLWSDTRLDMIQRLSETKKTKGTMIVQSNNPTKNTAAGVAYCQSKGIDFELVGGLQPDDFLRTMATYRTLVFIPKVLETFCRLIVEAKMMNCQVNTVSSLIGAASEEHISLNGTELIEETRQRIKKAIDLFAEIIERPVREKRKKIAFIGKFRKLYDEEGKALSLEKQGYEVLRFDEDTFGASQDLNNQDILIRSNPDFVFYAKLRIPNQDRFMSNLKRNCIKTVCWVPDLYFGTPREKEAKQRFPMFQADYVFSPDGGNQHLFLESGINHYPLKDGIFLDNCLTEEEVKGSEKSVDILFVGSLDMNYHGQNRYKLLHFLQKTYGDKFLWVGRNNSDEYREHRLTELIKSAKVVIGDCVESKNVWSNRLYETIGRGGLIIHPYVEGIEEHYKNGQHFVTFERNNFNDLKQKIDYFLDNPKDREEIILNGTKHTRENHTLDNRASYIIEIIDR